MNAAQLRETAIHEAGHAVASWLVGEHIDHATVGLRKTPEGTELGHVLVRDARYAPHMLARPFATPSERVAFRTVAGPAAEHVYADGDVPKVYGREPLAAWIHIATNHRYLDVYGMETFIARTVETLKASRVGDAIRTVSAALLAKGTLGGGAIDHLIRRSFGKREPARTPPRLIVPPPVTTRVETTSINVNGVQLRVRGATSIVVNGYSVTIS